MRLFVWCRVFSTWEKEERGGAAQGGFVLLFLFTPFNYMHHKPHFIPFDPYDMERLLMRPSQYTG